MTDYATMPAGRALDALVAEKVMGWRDCDPTRAYSTYQFGDPGDEFAAAGLGLGNPPDANRSYLRPYPRVSTSIAAAWEVVEKMRDRGHDCDLMAHWGADKEWWTSRFPGGEKGGHEQVRADTAPLAICRAALAAVEAR